MKRYKLTIQYDGTAYHGWQLQQNKKLSTIQAQLERALALIYKGPVKVLAAGRTDQGVHAEGQVITFDSDGNIPVDRVVCAINSILPDDIVVVNGEEVDLDFHPRYHAKGKWYCYTIFNDKLPNAFMRNFSWYIPYQLNLTAMKQAGYNFLGTYDFRSFCNTKAAVKSFTRTVEQFQITQEGKLLYIELQANGFLYNMVRIIVGTLVEVGRERLKPEDIPAIITGKNRRLAGPTAPPQGLCLKKVKYEDIQ